jgi:carbonic anhydrase
MQKLIDGVHRFRQDEFGRYRKLFRRLSSQGQNPHTLFITCADSRVLAELITQSKPGDLFVVKNVGNIVPPANSQAEGNSTGAAIEFAVERLGVTDIVVCGHSQCGAIATLMEPEKARDLPHLYKWIELAAPVREVISRDYKHLQSPEERIRAAEEENVLFSLERLHSYPCVMKRLEQGTIRLHAWFFKIANAELFAYDPELNQFTSLQMPDEEGHPHPQQELKLARGSTAD